MWDTSDEPDGVRAGRRSGMHLVLMSVNRLAWYLKCTAHKNDGRAGSVCTHVCGGAGRDRTVAKATTYSCTPQMTHTRRQARGKDSGEWNDVQE